MDRRKRIFNLAEAAVNRQLSKYAEENGYKIYVKMRLRDAIDIDGMETSARERDFAWKSHLDFVCVDEEENLPVLAVEYDGHQHLTDARQRDRDKIKDTLCRQAELPLLRIDSEYARKEGKWRVLDYILSVHESAKAFHEAQRRGHVPADEDFYHGLIIELDEEGNASLMGLDMPANRFLLGFRDRQQCLWQSSWWRARDGQCEARTLLALPNGLYLTSYCSLRDFTIEGVGALTISEELAVAELGWKARSFEEGGPYAIGKDDARQIRSEVEAEGSGWSFSGGWGRGPK